MTSPGPRLLAAVALLACAGAGSGAAATAATAAATAAPATPDANVIPAERRTTWRPGIPGGIPVVGKRHTTVDAAYGDGKRDATAAINAAIQEAGRAASRRDPKVVFLPPGTYRTTGIVELNRSHVVLRGAGPERTRIRLESSDDGAPAIRMGAFWPEYGRPVDVLGSVPRGATTLTVADAKGIEVGDVLQLDQLDDPRYVAIGDGVYTKRGPRPDDANGPTSPGGYRSVGQQIEVVSKKGRTLGLAGPVHIAFEARFSPQVFKTATARPGEPGTRYVGLEDLAVTGGNNNNVFALNVAYCWISNVESDGDPASGPGVTGIHLALSHAYRCEVRRSHVHHARSINPGGGAYGIAIQGQSSENLVEDNIVRYLNKPVVMLASGGGNVVAYNYVDDAFIASNGSWQESAIDGNHASFSHHDLFEGNWAANIGSDSTHGNSGWHTFFRNYASGTNATEPRTANVRAVGVDGYSREHTFVGNVLLQPSFTVNGARAVYESTSPATLGVPAVYRVGASSLGGPVEKFDDGTALRLLFRHGNFDFVSNRVVWDPGTATRTLPPSLYLTAKPAFFGDERWPFVDPLGEPKVGVLPAKKRFDAMRRPAR